MITTERVFEEISKVRDVAKGIDAAYVARSRVGRLTLSLARLVATRTGMGMPDRPGTIMVSKDVPLIIRQLADSCNKLLEASRSICQPSEPLDTRWRNGWSTLLHELDVLEMMLREIGPKFQDGWNK